MFTKKNHSFKNLILIIMLASLFACNSADVAAPVDGGGGTGGGNQTGQTINGIVALGPVEMAGVTAYDFSSGSPGAEIAVTNPVTSTDGKFTITLTGANGPVLLCSRGGTYFEPASAVSMNTMTPEKTKVTFGMMPGAEAGAEVPEELCAVLNYTAADTKDIAITYYTHLAYALVKYKLADPANTMTVAMIVTTVNQQISKWIDVNIISTIPIDPTDDTKITTDLTDEYKYGLANAAVSSLIKEVAMMGTMLATSGDMVYMTNNSKTLASLAFKDLMSDSWLDGKSIEQGSAVTLQIANQAITKLIYRDDLAKNIIKFANSAENKTTLKATTAPDSMTTTYANTVASFKDALFIVTPMNDAPPVTVNDPADTTKILVAVGTTITIPVLTNDTDDGPAESLIAMMPSATMPSVMGAATMAMLDPLNKNIMYNTSTLVAGDTDSFTYMAFDGYQTSAVPATVSLQVVDPVDLINTPPVASTTVTSTVVSAATQNFLASQLGTDAQFQTLVVASVEPPISTTVNTTNSTTTLLANGSIDFKAGNSTGIETFNFTLMDSDNAVSNTGTVTVTIDAKPIVNLAPVITLMAGPFTATIGSVAEIEVATVTDDGPITDLSIAAIPIADGSLTLDTSVTPARVMYKAPVTGTARTGVAINIAVNDSGSPVLTATAAITVDLVTGNQPPVLTVVNAAFTATIGSLTETEVATVIDDGLITDLSVTAIPVADGSLRLDTSVTPAKVLYKSPATGTARAGVAINIVVTDSGTPILNVTTPITVDLVTGNQPPILTIVNAAFTATIGSLTETEVATVIDDGLITDLSVSAIPVADGSLRLDTSVTPAKVLYKAPATGTVRAGVVVNIVVNDSGIPSLSATGTVTVNLQNAGVVNIAPNINTPINTISATVGRNNAQSITVTAQDPDNNPTPSKFRIDSITNPILVTRRGTAIIGSIQAVGMVVTYTPPTNLELEANRSITLTYTITVTDSLDSSAPVTGTIILTGIKR